MWRGVVVTSSLLWLIIVNEIVKRVDVSAYADDVTKLVTKKDSQTAS